MDVFKISVDTQQVQKITQENFDLATKKQAPWYQPINGHQGWFAVCPACDNPIQIIGMLERDSPYGKHFFPTSGAVFVPLKGRVDKEEYEWCPYASKNKHLTKDELRAAGSELAVLIKQTLIDQFDRVIYLLEKGIGMKISFTLAKQMLEDYRQAEGWRYRGATRQNLPWVFAYMMQAKRLRGRIFSDAEFTEKLFAKRPDLTCNANGQIDVKDDKKFCDLSFSFIRHRRHVDQHTLSESIEFNIANSKQETVCKREIVFEHDHFLKLINSKNEAHRRMNLVALARNVLV
ncbi:hypothetical protein [Pectobacterium brasiliense]|uniref:hypothetical protein n=1 Tax=Pectobacterium brasiliense TaxID=180957 RepID=UPI000583CDB3|nr:hypothetical protein [Pectobacterium brasiliense]KHT25960.1 hypothetical protein RC95_01785 [Pectobacterium brasiliense]MBN3131968.1 hypothetical protein [Pectobacterium brasiliense]